MVIRQRNIEASPTLKVNDRMLIAYLWHWNELDVVEACEAAALLASDNCHVQDVRAALEFDCTQLDGRSRDDLFVPVFRVIAINRAANVLAVDTDLHDAVIARHGEPR